MPEYDWGAIALSDLHRYWDEIGGLPAELKRRLKFGTCELRDKWNFGSKDQDNFYANETGDSYIFDLTAWHKTRNISLWFTIVDRYLRRHCASGDRILDYGAGIGTYSLIASALGLRVDACDINSILRDYMDKRAEYHSLPINTVEQPSGKYKALVCLDTIEHLAMPEEFPAQAHRLLEESGILIATWTFHTSGGAHPMHHTEEKLGPFLRELSARFEGPLYEGWPAAFRAVC